MESVVFDGKEYVKASVLAAKFRYTQDYLGQLCRGKKVDARLVGRAWYINLDSLESHRSSRYKEKMSSADNPSEISTKNAIHNYLSRVDVEPVLKSKTVKIVKTENGKTSEVPVRYETDDFSLIPKVNKHAVTTSLPVLPAEAEKLPISSEKPFTNFTPEPLPEVFLSGAISVERLPESQEIEWSSKSEEGVADEKKSNIAIKTKPNREILDGKPRIVSVRKITKEQRKAAFIERVHNRVAAEKEPLASSREADQSVSSEKEKHVPLKITDISTSYGKPDSMVAVFQSNEPHPSKLSSPDQVKSEGVLRGLSIAVVVLVFACTVALGLLSLTTEVIVEGGVYSDRFIVEISNLAALRKAVLRY